MSAVTAYYQAQARYERQLNRYFGGIVSKWQSTKTIKPDAKLEQARRERDAAIAALSGDEKARHVFGKVEGQARTPTAVELKEAA